jgi:hypothetical protein
MSIFSSIRRQGPPNVLVEPDQTVVLSTDPGRGVQLPSVALRPKTPVALAAMFGVHRGVPVRPSDQHHFERVDATDGLVRLRDAARNGDVAGHSYGFLYQVLQQIDGQGRLPARIRVHPARHSGPDRRRVATPVTTPDTNADARSGVVDVATPAFLVDLSVVMEGLEVQNIVVGYHGTLVIDADVSFLLAHDFVMYQGATVIQNSPSLHLDVVGRMVGDLPLTLGNAPTTVMDGFDVDWKKIKDAVTKTRTKKI